MSEQQLGTAANPIRVKIGGGPVDRMDVDVKSSAPISGVVGIDASKNSVEIAKSLPAGLNVIGTVKLDTDAQAKVSGTVNLAGSLPSGDNPIGSVTISKGEVSVVKLPESLGKVELSQAKHGITNRISLSDGVVKLSEELPRGSQVIGRVHIEGAVPGLEVGLKQVVGSLNTLTSVVSQEATAKSTLKAIEKMAADIVAIRSSQIDPKTTMAQVLAVGSQVAAAVESQVASSAALLTAITTLNGSDIERLIATQAKVNTNP